MNVVGRQVEGKRVNMVALEEGIVLTIEHLKHGLWLTTHVDTTSREELGKRDSCILLLLDVFVNGNQHVHLREVLVNKLRELGFGKNSTASLAH